MNLARDMILEAITRIDNDPEIHSNCGAIMNMLGRHMEAEPSCRYVIEMTPCCAEAYSNLGVALEMQGRFDEASVACEQALKIQPNYPEAQINLGILYVRSGNLIDAVEAYSTVIKKAPKNPMAWANMSVILLRFNEAEAAEALAHEAFEINPNYIEALVALGSAYHAQKYFERAIIYFEKALAQQPLTVEAGMRRAKSLQKCGRLKEAIFGYKALIKENKVAAEVFCGLGQVLLENDDTDSAIIAFRRAIEIKPNYGNAHFNLLRTLGISVDSIDLKNIQTAIDETKANHSDQIDLYFALGEALGARQEYDREFKAFSSGNVLQTSIFKANEMGFDPEVFDQQIDMIINSFQTPSHYFQSNSVSAIQIPVFILGLLHFGIENIAKAISVHGEVKVIGEIGTLIKFAGRALGGFTGIKDVWDEIVVEADRMFSANKNSTYIVDTTAGHFMYLGIIERLFPKARIIHCYNNQVDVGLSCYFDNSGGIKRGIQIQSLLNVI